MSNNLRSRSKKNFRLKPAGESKTPQQQGSGSTEQKEEPKKEPGEAKEEKPGNTLTDALAMPMMIPIGSTGLWYGSS